eukprot:5895828-Prorocentrum_lima.AAC.1
MPQEECIQKASNFLRVVIQVAVRWRNSCLALVLSFRKQPRYFASCTNGTGVPSPNSMTSSASPNRSNSHFV